MLQSILELKEVKTLEKQQQRNIAGGTEMEQGRCKATILVYTPQGYQYKTVSYCDDQA
ncbi:hypothetical protein ABW636_20480 [Aquimarina sp. 2201CG1-2-11]|uniref:hypothetical protein n=1 Tax=Aquimarina discodermiae TaxID=3231043 RepID=UPI003462058A